MAVILSSIGIASPLGNTPEEFLEGVLQDRSVLRPLPELKLLEHNKGAKVENCSLRGVLKKRKEQKLFTRAAALGLLAAYRCVGKVHDEELGLFVAVGREPPDEGDAEACLIASQKEQKFDEILLSTKGRNLYPPLLPLRTLPNMILAHISIQLGIMGENACWAGANEAAQQALSEGFWAIQEGRCARALVGAADGFVNLGAARDLHRKMIVPPSEGGIFFLLEHKKDPPTDTFVLSKSTCAPHPERDLIPLMGYCGTPQNLFGLLVLLQSQEFVSWGGISFRKTLQ